MKTNIVYTFGCKDNSKPIKQNKMKTVLKLMLIAMLAIACTEEIQEVEPIVIDIEDTVIVYDYKSDGLTGVYEQFYCMGVVSGQITDFMTHTCTVDYDNFIITMDEENIPFEYELINDTCLIKYEKYYPTIDRLSNFKILEYGDTMVISPNIGQSFLTIKFNRL